MALPFRWQELIATPRDPTATRAKSASSQIQPLSMSQKRPSAVLSFPSWAHQVIATLTWFGAGHSLVCPDVLLSLGSRCAQGQPTPPPQSEAVRGVRHVRVAARQLVEVRAVEAAT